MSEPRRGEISFEGVSKAFKGHTVLDNVSFEVSAGEALCLMGRSGTGKSVTLKLMIGLIRPDHGSIYIENQNVVDLDEDGLSAMRRNIGFLFQSAALFDSVSLNDNLALPLLRFKKKSKAEIDEIVQKELDAVGLGDARYKMPAELSGGMRKRAGLARALILEPSILLIDEPTSGLDRLTVSEIDDLLLGLKRKVTMVIVTHDSRGAKRVGDRLAVLDSGHLVAIGSAGELENHENESVRSLVSDG
ncbi:MAG TPA: ATP-binding cassette domain-containing protein [Bryobacteraceae bacterium]|jgi:phospholipid/cholesterol/gamma-HCH transport system ATP-binding protein|nr:ATP-binding cassette domain-containing protein [Bryobacteraceae bacterium]